jgi:S-formylglutathione hydrolase FrmB
VPRSLLAALTALALMVAAPMAKADQSLVTWDLPNISVSQPDALFGLTGVNVERAGPTGLRSWVLLPDGYTPDRCWPVLYLLHGSQNVDGWTGATGVLRGLPAIVVMPGGGDGQYSNWWNGGRMSPRWEDFFFDELMPKVNSTYNVCPQRSQHSIAGTSMGGYGAVLLGALRPGYFGSVGSFSGMLSILNPIVAAAQPDFAKIYGAPGGFYVAAHDPGAIAANLLGTRVYATVGDGTPAAPDDADSTGQESIIEKAATLFTGDFLTAARRNRLRVTYEQHRGLHNTRNFFGELAQFLAWRPFASSDATPPTWKYTTVAREGDAWGWRFRFQRQPRELVSMTYAKGQLRVLGGGIMSLTTPDGKHHTARLPFEVAGGRVSLLTGVSGPGASVPSSRGDIPVGLRPYKLTPKQALHVVFRAKRLPADQVYTLAVRQQVPGCTLNQVHRLGPIRTGKNVTVTIAPDAELGHEAHRWCLGHVKVVLMTTAKQGSGLDLGAFRGIAVGLVQSRVARSR